MGEIFNSGHYSLADFHTQSSNIAKQATNKFQNSPTSLTKSMSMTALNVNFADSDKVNIDLLLLPGRNVTW